jgi:hypothetical protein
MSALQAAAVDAARYVNPISGRNRLELSVGRARKWRPVVLVLACPRVVCTK